MLTSTDISLLFWFQDTPPGSTDSIPLSTFAVKNPSARLNFSSPNKSKATGPSDESTQPLLEKSDGVLKSDSTIGNGQMSKKSPFKSEHTELVEKPSGDKISLDSYDLEKNPFFTDD